MNNPTLCFKKSAVLEAGGYNEDKHATEDWMMQVSVLKQAGVVYNIEDVLLYYRIHGNQLTFQGKFNTPERLASKKVFLEEILKN